MMVFMEVFDEVVLAYLFPDRFGDMLVLACKGGFVFACGTLMLTGLDRNYVSALTLSLRWI